MSKNKLDAIRKLQPVGLPRFTQFPYLLLDLGNSSSLWLSQPVNSGIVSDDFHHQNTSGIPYGIPSPVSRSRCVFALSGLSSPT